MNYLMIIPILLAVAISYIITPFTIKFAEKCGAVDVPKDERRVHTKPMPLWGGVGMYISFFAVFFLFADLNSKEFIGLFIASTMMLGIGMIDDIRPTGAKTKLLIQILAACVLYFMGYQITFVNNIFSPQDTYILFNQLSFPITIIWIVGITNTINLIDGLDGLATGVSGISAATLGIVALLNGSPEYALILFILCGSTIGFLPYNFNPAKVFMGDAGALFLGIVLAAISVQGALKSATMIALIVPVLALGVPILDTFSAIVRRSIRRRPIMEADKEHLHHKLLSIGLNQKKAVLAIYVLSIMLGTSAIFLIREQWINSILTLSSVFLLILFPLNRVYSKN